MVAASKGKANFVRELLAHGADPNLEDSDNWTALLCAAKEGHADICLQLLEHNAELEHRDMVRNGSECFNICVSNAHFKSLKYVL